GAAAHDSDGQVRRIAMRAAAPPASPTVSADEAHAVLATGAVDDSPAVRVEALRVLRQRADPTACDAAVAAGADKVAHGVLFALERRAPCGASADAAAARDHAVADLPPAGTPRAWHRPAHALVALASASRERAAAVLPQFAGASAWQLRLYAARAAAQLGDRATLERLALDADDNVCETAVEALQTIARPEPGPSYAAH